MPRILHTIPLEDGHQLVIVVTAATGEDRGAFRNYARLVETDGTAYVRINSPNIIRVIASHSFDRRSSGPRSGFFAAVEYLRERMIHEAAAYRPGILPPADAYVVTADLLVNLPTKHVR